MTNKHWFLLAFFSCSLNAQALDKIANQSITPQEKINLAITKFEQTKQEDWAYKITRYENEEGDITSSIEQYNPIETPKSQWKLIRFNGSFPSQNQVKEFTEKKLAQRQEKSSNYSVPLRELINTESLTLSSETANYITMKFDVYLKKLGKDSKGKLTGSLTYNKQLAFIEEINIVNNSEFSPIFSANITDFKLTFTFTNISNNILPLQQNMAMKGTFAFFTEINEVSTDTYSNYTLPTYEYEETL